MDAKNRKAEALATELHLTETSLSERQAEVALLKGHERDYLQKIATLEVRVNLKERKEKTEKKRTEKKRKEKKRKEKKRKEKKRKEKKRKEKKRKEKKRKEKKRKEKKKKKTTPFCVNLMRSSVLYRAAQECQPA